MARRRPARAEAAFAALCAKMLSLVRPRSALTRTLALTPTRTLTLTLVTFMVAAASDA